MKRSLLALALVAVLPFAAQADDKLSYSYVEADYVNLDGDADGYGLRGAFEFGDSGFYGLGGWRSAEIDGTNIDIDQWELGVGYAHGAHLRRALVIATPCRTCSRVQAFRPGRTELEQRYGEPGEIVAERRHRRENGPFESGYCKMFGQKRDEHAGGARPRDSEVADLHDAGAIDR